jgi:hypothetical protein
VAAPQALDLSGELVRQRARPPLDRAPAGAAPRSRADEPRCGRGRIAGRGRSCHLPGGRSGSGSERARGADSPQWGGILICCSGPCCRISPRTGSDLQWAAEIGGLWPRGHGTPTSHARSERGKGRGDRHPVPPRGKTGTGPPAAGIARRGSEPHSCIPRTSHFRTVEIIIPPRAPKLCLVTSSRTEKPCAVAPGR